MTGTGTTRSFIAIPLPGPIRAQLEAIRDRLRPALGNMRWANPDTMHLTLHFFGDIDDANLEKARAVMVSIESLFSPFPMLLGGVGAFPSPDRARVVWLGVRSDRLAGLHAELIRRLKAQGFTCDERPFRPHITLGRSRGRPLKAGHILSSEKDTVAGEMTTDRLVLYESILSPTGARHRPRHTIHFTAD